MGIPLLVIMRDGKEVDRRAGALPEPQLRAWVEPQLAPPPAATAESPASAA
jgi:thioredoxin-like negative regulator of GroEL